jgi:hypothetical protein
VDLRHQRDDRRADVSLHRPEAHYGVVALPCRVGDPDRKGKVEAGVGHAQKTPLKGLRFETLEAAQAYLDRWEERWADTRIHGTTKRQVAEMFAEERPALGPLPVEPFRYYRYGERTVHLDGCVEVEAADYGAPPGWIGQRVQVQWNDLHVRLLAPKTGQLLREHLRAPRGWHRIQDDDRPARTPQPTVALLARAARAGAHISAICAHIHQHDGAAGVRRILGVLALAIWSCGSARWRGTSCHQPSGWSRRAPLWVHSLTDHWYPGVGPHAPLTIGPSPCDAVTVAESSLDRCISRTVP